MDFAIFVVKFLFLVPLVYSKVILQNPSFESPPTNLTTNATSQFVLLDAKTNVIPGWSFNGTVWYVTSGENISLPGNGHGLQLGPNGTINQTFKSTGSYDYVLTFTLAPSRKNCANNSTAVNVSGPGASKVFFFKESLGNEQWQTYGFSFGRRENRRGFMSVKIQSVATSNRSNITCWPIVDTLLVAEIESPRLYSDNGFVNSGFEVGPAFLENSSQGILLEADSINDLSNSVDSPLQDWTILGTVKYIDSRHFATPRGRAAVELVSGNPSGILKNVFFLRHGQVTLDFIMGDANDSCVGDFTVFLQVGNTIWNFTMRSIGLGSRERHSVTFKAEFGSSNSIPISFVIFNETRTSDHQVLCGPVIDSTNIWFSNGKQLDNKFETFFSLVFVLMFLFLA
ncbi:hypothetical protein L6452_21320 [Arctium lappa]|uniref:Uncharacterized protein n=1 Tax=Arctium lappa TaxID=4217 RepID=A0ACB9BD00_ARCLA|nr:hypothetical protein L6452_21320 [Arctium lappa]